MGETIKPIILKMWREFKHKERKRGSGIFGDYEYFCSSERPCYPAKNVSKNHTFFDVSKKHVDHIDIIIL
jgi:hypothetical protein